MLQFFYFLNCISNIDTRKTKAGAKIYNIYRYNPFLDFRDMYFAHNESS